jgi:flagellin
MALQINTNVGALMASAAASSVNKSMDTSMNRLATGLRINSAADDAAGVAIASRLTSEIRGTNQAIRNAADGQAMIDTAEGAQSEIVNILQRMREVSIQAANDTNNATDRSNLQAEMDQLTTEIDRIATTTSWAGKSLLDGSTPYDGSSVTAAATLHSDQAQFSFQVGTGTTANDLITANIGAVSSTALGISGDQPASMKYMDVSGVTIPTGLVAGTNDAVFTATVAPGSAAAGANAAVSTKVTFVSSANDATPPVSPSGSFTFALEGKDISVTIGANGTSSDATGIANATAKAINDAGLVGITASVASGVVTIDKTSSSSVSTTANATSTVDKIDAAINTVNTQRANLGSISNRLDSTVSNLTNIATNLEAGRSSIQDADFAAESTNLAKSQILQQASTAMLAQANASKQGVLQLLQG